MSETLAPKVGRVTKFIDLIFPVVLYFRNRGRDTAVNLNFIKMFPDKAGKGSGL